MHANIGDYVAHPQSGQHGKVIDILTNPACLLRTLVITWQHGETEELSELEFGPLDDSGNDAHWIVTTRSGDERIKLVSLR